MAGILRYFSLKLQRSILPRIRIAAKYRRGCSFSLQLIMHSTCKMVSLEHYFQDTSCTLHLCGSGISFLSPLFLGQLLHGTTGIHSSLCGARIFHHSSSTRRNKIKSICPHPLVFSDRKRRTCELDTFLQSFPDSLHHSVRLLFISLLSISLLSRPCCHWKTCAIS